MNLVDILNYRIDCLICNRRLMLQNTEVSGLIVFLNKNGLRVKLSYQQADFAQFNFDGTYERGKHGIWDMYTQPITIRKVCPVCVVEPHHPTTKHASSTRPFGPTGPSGQKEFDQATINNIGKLSCVYSFNLFSNRNVFHGNLKHETISFNDGKEFIHIYTNFIDDSTSIYKGSFSSTLGDMLSLKIPAVYLSNIKSKDKIIKKIKMYNIFS